MNEKEKINKIFSSLENYNFNYNKKIKFFDYSKNTEVKITLNDYLWLFFQSIDNIKIDNITFGTTFWKYIQNITKQKWVKNMEMKELCIDFSGDKILIKGIHDNNFEYFIDKTESFSLNLEYDSSVTDITINSVVYNSIPTIKNTSSSPSTPTPNIFLQAFKYSKCPL